MARRLMLSKLLPHSLHAAAAAPPSSALSASSRLATRCSPDFVPFDYRRAPPPTAAISSASRNFCTNPPPRDLRHLIDYDRRIRPPRVIAGDGDSDVLKIEVDMPGVAKSGVEVTVRPNQLVIRGERMGDPVTGETGAVYTYTWGIPDKLYRLDQAKAVIKNGAVRVAVPPVKTKEERGTWVKS